MTEVGWWYTGIFFVIIAVFYAIGFVAGKNWEKTTQDCLLYTSDAADEE